MPDSLSNLQYNLVHGALSFTIATMLAAIVFVFLVQSNVAKRYRITLIVTAFIAVIAGFHYFNLRSNFLASYDLVDGQYQSTGVLLGGSYRYVDWMLTVPLLVTQMVLILEIPRKRRRSLILRGAVGAMLMIGLGYPGEIADTILMRVLWGFAATIPFTYLLSMMWDEFSDSATEQVPHIRGLYTAARLLLLASWGFYPIVYIFPVVGLDGALIGEGVLFATVQVGYSVADITAKIGFGFMLYLIAQAKSNLSEPEGPADFFAVESEYAWPTSELGARPKQSEPASPPADARRRQR